MPLKKTIVAATLFILFTFNVAPAQKDSSLLIKEYNSIEEALKNPENVYRLNLSNQRVSIPKDAWSKFTKLEFLSLKNDHLNEIPKEIGFLKNLKTLDLSGNDFTMLPNSFSNLTNLQELFLNDEKNFVLNKNIKTLKPLSKLKILHLENDYLSKLPENFSTLNQLETLYLNNNSLMEIPKEIKGLKNLKYINIHNNKLKPENQHFQNHGFGFRVDF